MEFEFDPAKSKSNLHKHGIDFVQAQLLWVDERRLVIQARSNLDESRWAMIGCIEGECWTAIFTKRATNLRIISVRCAREEEKELYYGE